MILHTASGSKPRVALHIVMPHQVSGPNTAVRLIGRSWLDGHYSFECFEQARHAGGRLNLSLVRDMARQIRRIQPDIVHVSGLQAAGLHAVLAARLGSRAKILVTIRGFAGDDQSLGSVKRIVFNMIVEPLTLLLATRFHTVCAAASERRLTRLFKWKSTGVIHNSAPAIGFNVSKARRETRRRLGIGSEVFVAAVVGRMVSDKGIEYIAEAARNPALRTVTWLLIGDGPLFERFSAMWPDLLSTGRVVLTGRVEDAKPVVAAADLFVFGTLHENLSNALLEAMAIGLPVVATSVGGNVEVVQHGRNGLLVPPGSSDAIAAGVSTMLTMPLEQRLAWGTASAEIARVKFGQAGLLARLDQVYRSML